MSNKWVHSPAARRFLLIDGGTGTGRPFGWCCARNPNFPLALVSGLWRFWSAGCQVLQLQNNTAGGIQGHLVNGTVFRLRDHDRPYRFAMIRSIPRAPFRDLILLNTIPTKHGSFTSFTYLVSNRECQETQFPTRSHLAFFFRILVLSAPSSRDSPSIVSIVVKLPGDVSSFRLRQRYSPLRPQLHE